MRIKRIELKNFKRFTHLIVENIPESAKLVVLVGPNGSGKTSFLESMNYYYKHLGYGDVGDYDYLIKKDDTEELKTKGNDWYLKSNQAVDINFYEHDFENVLGDNKEIRGCFYFRSAYRNEPYFNIDYMKKQDDPLESFHLRTLIQDDRTVADNYQRLVSAVISEVYKKDNDSKSIAELRKELSGIISKSVQNVFDDLEFSSLGNPLENGNFYFTKGTVKNFSYQNLSAGEKSVFDMILDIVIKSKYYSDAIYCIDEPEAHMHTGLQGKVLRELYRLIPEKSQLWISTHSIGMLQAAEEIEKSQKGTVVFLDFGGRDYDVDQVMCPTKIKREVMKKFYELAFGDLAKLILPKTIVFCEGSSEGRNRKDFDKQIYTAIFEDSHPEALFISAGACNDIENMGKTCDGIINTLLKNVRIIRLIDRDDRSPAEIAECKRNKITVLERRSIESYLFDPSVIKKLCESVGKSDKYDDCIEAIKNALKQSTERNHPSDDYKSASGEIYNLLKSRLGLTKCGNNKDTFMRDTLCPLITSDMDVYKCLEREIFGEE